MSAFAARQKLLGLASPLTKSTNDNVTVDKNPAEEPDRLTRPKSPRKSKRKVVQSQAESTLSAGDDAASIAIVAVGPEAPGSVPPTPVLTPV